METFKRQLDPSIQISGKYNGSEKLMEEPENRDTSLSWCLGAQFGKISNFPRGGGELYRATNLELKGAVERTLSENVFYTEVN